MGQLADGDVGKPTQPEYSALVVIMARRDHV